MMTAQLFSPSHIVAIDLADSRLEAARKFGADIVVNSGRDDPALIIGERTGCLGADVTMETVGRPQTFEQAVRLVRPGGHVANIGVHRALATLHLEDTWIKNLTITTGLVASRRLDTSAMITHRFSLDEFETAYDIFANATDTGALKVLLTAAAR
jgi:alcohol dehydrogenase